MHVIHQEMSRHLPQQGEARRLFHGRGRCFPGFQDLCVDSYGTMIWVTLFSERPESWLKQLVETIRQVVPGIDCVMLQRRDLPLVEPRLLYGQLPETLLAKERGLFYELNLRKGLNIGFFIDMAAGRSLVGEISYGKKVLNLFAYSGSFSIAAIAGGADHVVNLDMNRGALEVARRNHLINGLDLRRASFLPVEFFRSVSRLRRLGPFDLIICDPPYSQGKNFTAETHWPKLVARLEQLLSPRAEILACLNAPQLGPGYLREVFRQKLASFTEVACLSAGQDFPEADSARGLSIHHFVSPRD